MNHFSRSQAVTVILLSLFLLCLYGWSHYTHHLKSTESPQLLPNYVFVQVSGEIRTPGIYSFDQPVTVSQAVARAGGLLSPLKWQAESEWTMLKVGNARKIHIRAAPNGAARLILGWMAVPSRLALGVPLDVNQASVADLALVPGINEKLAERIVTLGGRTGGFSRLADLCEVKGIGPVTLRRLQPYLTVSHRVD